MITRRGKVVLWILLILASLLVGYATADVCWVGNGYGSCKEMIDNHVHK